MRRRLRLARREMAALRSEKTIVLALVIQLFIAAFSSFLVVGLVSLYAPGSVQGGYTVQMGISGNASDELERVVEMGAQREAIVYESRAAAMEAFADREVSAVLHATDGPKGRIHVEAIAPEGGFQTTLVVTQIKAALTELEQERRRELAASLDRQPLPEPPEPDSNPYFGFTYTVLVPVLVFLPAFISGSIASDSIAEELERGTDELLRVTPLSGPQILDGKALAMIAIAPAQAALWLLFLQFNGTRIAFPLEILLLVGALAAGLVVFGAALALVVGVRREAQLLYSLSAMALFGGAMLLPESPPNLVAKLAVGTPTPVTHLTVAGLVVLAAGGYWRIRRVAARSDWSAQ
ncbi:MAG: ABC transporter permease [Halodesulfurarchaeum sp.]